MQWVQCWRGHALSAAYMTDKMQLFCITFAAFQYAVYQLVHKVVATQQSSFTPGYCLLEQY